MNDFGDDLYNLFWERLNSDPYDYLCGQIQCSAEQAVWWRLWELLALQLDGSFWAVRDELESL